MKPFKHRTVFSIAANMAELIRLYCKEQVPVNKIALQFNCNKEEVERALRSQGQWV